MSNTKYNGEFNINDVIIIKPDGTIEFSDGVNKGGIGLASITTDRLYTLPDNSGTLALTSDINEYDSGWKTMNWHNGTFGFANIGGGVPDIRVINKTVYIRGTYVFPMPTTAGGTTLDTDLTQYASNLYPDLYTGPDGGWVINPTGREEAETIDPILPTNLRPENNIVIESMVQTPLVRTVNINGRIRISHFASTMVIRPDGRLQINTIRTTERNGDTGTSWTKSLQSRYIVDRFEAGDSLYEFDTYYNSYDGGFTTDKRVVQDTGVDYPFSFDGTAPGDLGSQTGYIVTTYPLNPALTLDQIQTAFDSI